MRRLALLPLIAPAPALAAGVVAAEYRWLTLALFGAIIAITLFVTYWAAKRITSAEGFYAAGRSISGLQNGWAIAGDYLSAASFLGIAGLISLYGYDGFLYSVGFLVAYVTVLLVIAEPCRNIGKYTLGDLLAFRNDPKTAKIAAALATLTVSVFYLTAQMVGGGVLVKSLIGIDYEISVLAVGILMLAYVVFGGMVATTWVQIVKAVLLVSASLVLVVLVWAPYGFSLPDFLAAVVNDPKVQTQVAQLLGGEAAHLGPEALGQRFLEPGLFLHDPIDQISLGLALIFGTAGLPHILMRFFTVPTAQEARRSVVWAMVIIGGFYLLTLFLGLGAAIHVGAAEISAVDSGGNLAAPLLAQYLGGGANALLGNLLLAFVAAVAFATIVAVVAGLVLASASAIAHDIYVGVIEGERATPQRQVTAARIASLGVGLLAITIGILAKGQNVAHLVGMAFAVAASSNLPATLLTLYWRRCNTGGVVLGMALGAGSAIGLVLISPNMTYPLPLTQAAQATLTHCAAQQEILGQQLLQADAETRPQRLNEQAELTQRCQTAATTLARYAGQERSLVGLRAPLISLKNPGIISIPIGFLGVILGSLLFRDRRAELRWDELHVRQTTGIHAEGATAH